MSLILRSNPRFNHVYDEIDSVVLSMDMKEKNTLRICYNIKTSVKLSTFNFLIRSFSFLFRFSYATSCLAGLLFLTSAQLAINRKNKSYCRYW